MQIVIDIDDETYKQAINRTEFDTLSLGLELIEAVQNGTPLPEHHGDLIDRKDLIENGYQMEPIEMWYGIKYAPTIIEGGVRSNVE